MDNVKCPSEDWDTYQEQQEGACEDPEGAALDSLDAYGHLAWCVGTEGEHPDYPNEVAGDWLACFDYTVFEDSKGNIAVAYHVVIDSESGHFTDTLQQCVVLAKDAPFGLPAEIADTEQSFNEVPWTEEEIKDAAKCNEAWNKELKAAIKDAEEKA